MPVIPALQRLRREDPDFHVCLVLPTQQNTVWEKVSWEVGVGGELGKGWIMPPGGTQDPHNLLCSLAPPQGYTQQERQLGKEAG